jgi:hypothetical protein
MCRSQLEEALSGRQAASGEAAGLKGQLAGMAAQVEEAQLQVRGGVGMAQRRGSWC